MINKQKKGIEMKIENIEIEIWDDAECRDEEISYTLSADDIGVESVNDIDLIYKLHPNKSRHVKDVRGLVIKSFGRSGYTNKVLPNASQYNHGITNEDMSSRVNLAIPDYISKNSNNKYRLCLIKYHTNIILLIY